jgi:POT family proton-dependent oligopeptide transporter
VNVPPAAPAPHAFLRVVRTALLAPAVGRGRPGLWLAMLGALAGLASLAMSPLVGVVTAFCIGVIFLIALGGAGTWMQLDRARGVHPEDAIEGVRAVLRLLIVFALVTPFWSLFDQKASTWVLAADAMTKPSWFEPSQMQALNPALILFLIPFNNLVLYPAVRRLGWEPTRLRRMTLGLVFAALSWVLIGAIQLFIDGGDAVSIAWQVLPYAFLTFGEILISTTGLEFAYSQAPPSMKGVIMSLWYLGVTMGNVWVLLADASVRNEAVLARIADTGLSVTAFLMFFFAAFAFVAAAAFGWYARRYRMVDHYRSA